MLKRMFAIEYNSLMTLLTLISTKMPIVGPDYGLTGMSINVIPAYPKDLSKFTKPSIIVQKISSDQDTISFGNYLGQHFDEETNTYYDVHGKQHEMTYQINVETSNDSITSLVVAAITEGILNPAICYSDGQDEVKLKDFVTNINNPTDIGLIRIDNTFDIMTMQTNRNNDYMTIIRFDITVVQSVVLPQELIDLSKGIRFNQTIIL